MIFSLLSDKNLITSVNGTEFADLENIFKLLKACNKEEFKFLVLILKYYLCAAKKAIHIFHDKSNIIADKSAASLIFAL